eukprot:418300_1
MGSYIYSEYCEDKNNENTANVNSIWSLFGYEENNDNKDDAKYNNNNKISKSWLKKIRIERGVIEHFIGYQGKIQYYKVGNWTSHGSVVVRKEEGNSKIAAKCHLILDSYSTGWIVKVEQSTWRPNLESIVTDSKYSWNIIKALSAVYHVSSHFGAWNYFMNNCQHFRNDIVDTMLDKDLNILKELMT